jgi:hypothetical protein
VPVDGVELIRVLHEETGGSIPRAGAAPVNETYKYWLARKGSLYAILKETEGWHGGGNSGHPTSDWQVVKVTTSIREVDYVMRKIIERHRQANCLGDVILEDAPSGDVWIPSTNRLKDGWWFVRDSEIFRGDDDVIISGIVTDGSKSFPAVVHMFYHGGPASGSWFDRYLSPEDGERLARRLKQIP